MKNFGILMIVLGFVCLSVPLVSGLLGEKKPDVVTALEVHDKQGQSITLWPLLGIVSLATGGAMVTASFLTKRK